MDKEKGKEVKRPPVAIHQRGTPLKIANQGESIHSLLLVEEKETQFNSPENARRAVSTINSAISKENQNIQIRASRIVSTWLSQGDTQWIEALNTPSLFNVTLEIARSSVVWGNKNTREKFVKAFLNRLRASRDSIEWLHWLRSALGRSDLQLTDIRPSFENLVQILISLILKTKHAITVAPRSSSSKKMTELWAAHTNTSIQVCQTMKGSPDGLATLFIAMPANALKHLPSTLNCPGAFALRASYHLVLGSDPELLDQESQPWLAQTPLVMESQKITFAESESWMEICTFVLRICSVKSKNATSALSFSMGIILHVFSEYTEFYFAEFPTSSSRKNAPTPAILQTLDAIRNLPEMTTIADLLQSLRNRHLLFEIPDVADYYYKIMSGLVEVGVFFIVEQLVRFGTVLLTQSWSLSEGDALEQMIYLDLEWLSRSSANKSFADGRLILRICQACAWPVFCPRISDKVLAFAKTIAAQFPQSQNSPGWEQIKQLLQQRYQRRIDLFSATPPKSNTVSSSLHALAKLAFLKQKHNENLIPVFSRREFANNPVQDSTRVIRAKRFADAVLTVLDGDREPAAEVFWESLLESDQDDEEGREPDSHDKENDLDSWLSYWGSRGLSISSLKSKAGSAKDTFEYLESALTHRIGALDDVNGSSKFLLNFLWNFHREILVFAPIHSDSRVSSFFSKNVETCQHWLLRLVNIALEVENKISNGHGSCSSFYFLHYDYSAKWTNAVLQNLAKKRDPSSIRALSCRNEIFNSPATRSWCEAFELFAEGAYCKSSKGFEHVLQLCREEEDDHNEIILSSSNFLLECKMRLGLWKEAEQVIEEQQIQGKSKLVKFLLREGMDPSENSINAKTLEDPLLSFLRWCDQPSSTTKAENLKSVCIRAQLGGWNQVEELTSFAFGGKGYESTSDEFWSIIDSARVIFGLPPDSNRIARMCITALNSSDTETCSILLDSMRGTRPTSHDLNIELATKLFLYPNFSSQLNFLAPEGSIERDIVQMKSVPQSIREVTSSPLAPRYYFTLAHFARKMNNFSMAASFHKKCLDLDNEGTLTLQALLLYLVEVGDNHDLLSFPNRVLNKALSHILARSKSKSFGPVLEKLARNCARDVIWGLVAESPSSPSIELAKQAIDQNLLNETEKLKSALVRASRTHDEEWEDFFEEMQKKPWLKRILTSSSSSSPLVVYVQNLWNETLGNGEQSKYHERFLKSEAGEALATWVKNPSDWSNFLEAKNLVTQWINSQGTKRVASELCDFLTGTFSEVPGEDDAAFEFDKRVDVLKTKTRPRKIGFRQGKKLKKSFLLKSAEDLRLDQRLVQLWEMVCGPTMVRPYLVIPLSRRVGLIQWVERTVPLFHAYREWKDTSVHRATLEVEKGERLEVTEQYQKVLMRTEDRDKLAAFREIKSQVDSQLLSKFIWKISMDPESWWKKRENFATSCGSTSSLGWIVGLGDRHLDNILLDLDSGELIHVDLNVCFDKGLKLRVPETVPFRLTGIMTGAMPFGSSKKCLEKGLFGSTAMKAVDQINAKREEIMAFLETFVHDPIRSVRTSGVLDLTEFDSLKVTFIEEAQAWLQDPIVKEMRAAGDEVAINGKEEDEPPKLVLERARAACKRTQAECGRQKEKVAGSLAKILGSENVLKRPKELGSDDVNSLSESVRPTYQALAKSEFLASQIATQALFRCFNSIKTFNSTMSKLPLPCVEWYERLGKALQKVEENEWLQEDQEIPPVVTRKVFVDVEPTDIQNIADFRVVCQSIMDAAKIDLTTSDMKTQQIAQKLERVQKRINDLLALAEAILTISNEVNDEWRSAQQAFKQLKRAFNRVKNVNNQPLRENACHRAPDCSDFMSLCSQLRKDVTKLSKYQEIVSSGLVPINVDVACQFLEEALTAIPDWIPDDPSDKLEAQAKQANARVAARLEEVKESTSSKVVSTLIEQAVNEKNLSEMWIGWMPFL